jgi:diketogulonate reductase-like aldo/keto reductase
MPIPTTPLPDGTPFPVLGQGTWRMGENADRRDAEIAALQLGLELGIGLIDTAEMYGEGGAEKVVGAAISGRRDQAFVVSKLYPHNASRGGVVEACERSLQRLGTDRIDLYLLHWRGAIPLERTVAGFLDLQKAGKIRYWGVSNFDTDDMEELAGIAGAEAVATNQVLYNLTQRGIEHDLLPWCRQQALPVMAYSPIGQGALAKKPALVKLARDRNVTAAQLALAWVLARPGVSAIPKAVDPQHLLQIRAAVDIRLDAAELAEIDRLLPPPRNKTPLAMI